MPKGKTKSPGSSKGFSGIGTPDAITDAFVDAQFVAMPQPDMTPYAEAIRAEYRRGAITRIEAMFQVLLCMGTSFAAADYVDAPVFSPMMQRAAECAALDAAETTRTWIN